jgi:ParB family chromosome partitioning protein
MTTKVIESRKVNDLATDKTLMGLFLRPQAAIDLLAENMRGNGFRPDKPIVVDARDNTIIDGHTRKAAAELAEIRVVPVYAVTFEGNEERIEWALAEQRERRDLTDGNILQCVSTLKEKGFCGLRAKKQGEHDYKRVADAIGCTVYKVQTALEILKAGKQEAIDDVLADKCTLHKAKGEIKSKTPAKKKDSQQSTNARLAALAVKAVKQATALQTEERDLDDAFVTKFTKAVQSGLSTRPVPVQNPSASAPEGIREIAEDYDWFVVGTPKA